jgi:imidazolonepropionase-like amidohydrolase
VSARYHAIIAIILLPACGTHAERAGSRLDGLADAHVHLSAGEGEHLDSLIAHGITVVRDCGGDLDQLSRWRSEIEAGTRQGPRLLIAGPTLDGPKPGAEHRITIRTPAQADSAVDFLASAGVDFIKVHNGVPPDAFFAVLRRARTHGLRVAAHLPRGVPAWVAADSGVGSIEHAAESLVSSPIYAGAAKTAEEAMLWWYSAAGDSAVARLAASGVTIVPTLVRYEASVRATPDSALSSARAAFLPKLLDLVGRMHRAGVPILAGSDLVGLDGAPEVWLGPAREIELLRAAGLTAEEASVAASARALLHWLSES